MRGSLRSQRSLLAAAFIMGAEQPPPFLGAAVADPGEAQPEIAMLAMVGDAPRGLDDVALGGVEPDRAAAGAECRTARLEAQRAPALVPLLAGKAQVGAAQIAQQPVRPALGPDQ